MKGPKEKMFEICKGKKELLLRYAPYTGTHWIFDSFEDEYPITIKNTFTFTAQDLLTDASSDDAREEVVFRLGTLVKDHFKIPKEILETKYDVYFDKSIKRFPVSFFVLGNISVLSKVLKLVDSDLYIENDEVHSKTKAHIPLAVFKQLIDSFPTATELKKYSENRVAVLLSEYFDGLDRYRESYEKYLTKRVKREPIGFRSINEKKLELLEASYSELKKMLEQTDAYSETHWQEKIKDILCVVFPQYICALRHVPVGKKRGVAKTPDFLLIDANGGVDVMEIKRPDQTQIVRAQKIRNNYVPQKLFIDTAVQTSAYIYALTANVESNTVEISKRVREALPSFRKEILINNPRGIMLFGRSDKLTAEQRFDFELIRKQYKDIPTIMTYDDLLELLSNIIENSKKILTFRIIDRMNDPSKRR